VKTVLAVYCLFQQWENVRGDHRIPSGIFPALCNAEGIVDRRPPSHLPINNQR
jgi:hypothetical protein